MKQRGERRCAKSISPVREKQQKAGELLPVCCLLRVLILSAHILLPASPYSLGWCEKAHFYLNIQRGGGGE